MIGPETWSPGTNSYEAALAADLMDVERGDRIRVYEKDGREGEESVATVAYVDDRSGVREIRATRSDGVVFWVVRGRFVFVTTRDGEPILMPAQLLESRCLEVLDS